MHDRYGSDVLSAGRHPRRAATSAQVVAAGEGLVVECATSGFCGAITGFEKTTEGVCVALEDRNGLRRLFPLLPGAFLVEGKRATLVRPTQRAPRPDDRRSASGSVYVSGVQARVARASRIWVEGLHDAELVEKVWGHDLRVEGVVVEPLHGADDLTAAIRRFGPGPQRRIGVLLDHMVPGTKETRLADEARRAFAPHVEVVGHPYVDVWQAIRPAALEIRSWPVVPPGRPWKAGVIAALGLPPDERDAWNLILARVHDFTALEPAFLGRVEQLIDFVTAP